MKRDYIEIVDSLDSLIHRLDFMNDGIWGFLDNLKKIYPEDLDEFSRVQHGLYDTGNALHSDFEKIRQEIFEHLYQVSKKIA